MSGRYSVEDLLKLRASPLICKPPNLPAIEDILSAAQDSRRPTARGRGDDPHAQGEGFPTRPLLESQRKSTTDPDRIVLGPPRRSFASSYARAAGKSAENGTEDVSSEREKTGFERFKSSERYDRRGNQINGRFSKDGEEDKPRRRYDDDEEPRPRRDYERKPKWAGGTDSADDTKRDSRAKLDQPWYRNEKETKQDSDRRHDWRRSGGQRDRGSGRPDPVEDEPEWMDEPAETAAAPARTQEDFQRWKERMKAGKTGADSPSEAAIQSPMSPAPPIERPSTFQFLDAEADDSMDKFFAKFNENKSPVESTQPSKPATKTRFASLFGQPPPSQAQAESVPKQQLHVDLPLREKSEPAVHSPPPSSTDADQAGFARILEMLQGRSSNPTPQHQDSKQSRLPLYARDSQKAEQQKPPQSPLMELLKQQAQRMEDEPPGQHAGRIQEPRSPVEQGHARQTSNKDELLLNLLRQANQAHKPTPIPQQNELANQEQYLKSRLYPDSESFNRAVLARNQMISPPQANDPALLQRREISRSISDGPSQVSFRYQDEQPHDLGRRQTNDTPKSPYDEQLLSFLRSGGKAGPQNGLQQPPPGLARPPGFEQMHQMQPPQHNWPGKQLQPMPQRVDPNAQRQPAIPPGMAPPGRPPYANMQPPLQQQRAPPLPPLPGQGAPLPRKYTGESGMPSNLMQPPPGFMTGGPPPGFPADGRGMYPGHGHGHGPGPGPGPQPRFPPEQGPGNGFPRGLMEMYGDGRSGLRGNVNGGMLGGYR